MKKKISNHTSASYNVCLKCNTEFFTYKKDKKCPKCKCSKVTAIEYSVSKPSYFKDTFREQYDEQ